MKDNSTNTENINLDSSSKEASSLSKPTIKNPEFLIITPDNNPKYKRKKVFIIPIIVTALLLIGFTLFMIFSSSLNFNSPFQNTLDKFLSSIYNEDISKNKELILPSNLDAINKKLEKEDKSYKDFLKDKNEEYKSLYNSNWYNEVSYKEVLTLSTNEKKFINVLDSNNKILFCYQVIKIDNDYKVNFEF